MFGYSIVRTETIKEFKREVDALRLTYDRMRKRWERESERKQHWRAMAQENRRTLVEQTRTIAELEKKLAALTPKRNPETGRFVEKSSPAQATATLVDIYA